MSTNTPSQSNNRAFGRTEGAADAMHFTTPNLSPRLFFISKLPNFEAPVPVHDDDDGDKNTVFLAKMRFFEEDDEAEVVSGEEHTALVAIAISYLLFFF